MSLLEIRGLVSGYGRVPVLHGVDLEVEQGELVTVIGSNGAGKSTLLRTISGVNPAFAGSVVFDGKDLTKAGTARIAAAGIAHVPEGRRVFAEHSIEENLLIGGYVRRRQRDEVRADIAAAYERFPVLGERRESPAGTLSGGEQQMLAIAMALLARPRLLMLDEPSLGLAPLVVGRVFEHIRSLRAAGTTILLVEQIAQQALSVADRGIVLSLGEVVTRGTAAELRADPAVQAAYLGA